MGGGLGEVSEMGCNRVNEMGFVRWGECCGMRRGEWDGGMWYGESEMGWNRVNEMGLVRYGEWVRWEWASGGMSSTIHGYVTHHEGDDWWGWDRYILGFNRINLVLEICRREFKDKFEYKSLRNKLYGNVFSTKSAQKIVLLHS